MISFGLTTPGAAAQTVSGVEGTHQNLDNLVSKVHFSSSKDDKPGQRYFLDLEKGAVVTRKNIS